MDLTYKTYDGREISKAKAVVSFNDSAIENKGTMNKINQAVKNRRATMERTMRDIVLECALGADREAFMKMLDEVVIE